MMGRPAFRHHVEESVRGGDAHPTQHVNAAA